jgi:hypothetical protein
MKNNKMSESKKLAYSNKDSSELSVNLYNGKIEGKFSGAPAKIVATFVGTAISVVIIKTVTIKLKNI